MHNIYDFFANLHNYFDIHVCPSLWRPYGVRPSRPVPLPSFIIFRVPDAQSDCTFRGKAEVLMLDFKWSEFQKCSQTAAERAKAELRILNFKTTWSEFQKPCKTAAARGKAELRILNFKTT